MGGSNVFKTMGRFQETFRELTERWRENFYAALPPNWRALDEAEVEAIGDLMVETGWSLVWSPSPNVLRSVLAAADHRERKAVLVMSEGQIVDDLERLLDGRTSDAVSELRDSAREGIEAYRSGFFRSAQALAGAALTHGMHDHFGRRDFGELRRELGKLDPDEVGFALFRTALVLAAAHGDRA